MAVQKEDIMEKRGEGFLADLQKKTLRLKMSQKIFFTENLRVMIGAGLSLTEALRTLAMQTDYKPFRDVILDIHDDVRSGTSLSEALRKYPKLFQPIFINMIAAGEKSGTMEQTLEQLASQMQKDYELISKIRGALTYPAVIVAATALIGTGMMIFVIPQILSIFEEIGAEKLPLATRILIGLSEFITNYWFLVIAGFIGFIAGFIWFIRTTPGKYAWHAVLLKLPIVAPIIRKVNLARLSRTLSALLRTDIPIVESLKITSDIVGNVYYRDAIIEASQALEKGQALSESLAAYPKLFTPLVVQMTTVGERAGTVDEMLEEIADFYESKVRNIMENMSSIIEPVLIIFLGVAVGGIALAIITPIYSLTTEFGQ